MSRPFVDMNDSYSYEDWMNDMATNEEACSRDRVYFQTTRLSIDELSLANVVCMEQGDLVLAIFQNFRRPMTPWEVWQEGVQNGRQWLITSVRRSMSVLSAGEAPALIKLDSLRMGPHGKPSHEWCLPEDRPEAKA